MALDPIDTFPQQDDNNMANDYHGHSTTSGSKLTQSSRENDPKNRENKRRFEESIVEDYNCLIVKLPNPGEPIDVVALMQEFLDKLKKTQRRSASLQAMRTETVEGVTRRFIRDEWLREEMMKLDTGRPEDSGPSLLLLATQGGTAAVLDLVFPEGVPKDIAVKVIPAENPGDDQEVIITRITETVI